MRTRGKDQFLSCARKEGYSFAVARRIAKRIRRANDGEIVAEYKCQFCGRWHVGSNSDELARKAARRAGA